MPRNPFFTTRAAEVAANIIMSELDLFRGSVFTVIEPQRNGDVFVETRRGNALALRWNVSRQCIQTIDMELNSGEDQVQVLEIAA